MTSYVILAEYSLLWRLMTLFLTDKVVAVSDYKFTVKEAAEGMARIHGSYNFTYKRVWVEEI